MGFGRFARPSGGVCSRDGPGGVLIARKQGLWQVSGLLTN